MARLIANERVKVVWYEGFDAFADYTAPTLAELNSLTGSTDLTCYLASLTANATGNTVPTPDLCSLFETSVPGTSTATFTSDMYLDDEGNIAWTTLPRGAQGYFVISRMLPVGQDPTGDWVAANEVEVWPAYITSRSAGQLASNTVQVFTVTSSVPKVPVEDYAVPAV